MAAKTITGASKVLAIGADYLNLPVQKGIDRNGYWYLYTPVNAQNDTLGAAIKPYKWGSLLSMPNSATSMQIEGTMPLILEPWNGSNQYYHGGGIVHIGAGVNDITGAIEDDAFFFAHLGSLSPATDDDAFYWDRAYLPAGSSNWLYYQYHKHLPTFYPRYENGRLVINSTDYIHPEDKSYGYLLHSRISVGGIPYQSVLARIHTPSVGGAHNSHNDVTLPTVSAKDYQAAGMLKGAGDRYHAFYITSSGSDWVLYCRTFLQASQSFTSEVNLGTYDFADPTINTTDLTGTNYNCPVRAGAGEYFDGRIYFPVVLNGGAGTYNLEVWSFNSLDTIAGGSLVRHVIATTQAVRPDVHMEVVAGELYLVTTKTTSNGVSLYSFDGTTWSEATSVIFTNGSNPIRVHGIGYNTEDVNFYILLSGTSSGTGTYTGPGLYKFNLQTEFGGYKHLDYDYTTNSFLNKAPLTAGYLKYSSSSNTLTKFNTTEPQGIEFNTSIFTYNQLKPTFFNRDSLGVTHQDEYVYQGIRLKDNRRLLVGRVELDSDSDHQSDLFFSLVSQNNQHRQHFSFGGVAGGKIGGDDYITGAFQSTSDPNKIWITGYTKSELVERKDIRIHGYARRLTDAPSVLQWLNSTKDTSGSIYGVGTSNSDVGIVAKYDSNSNLVWQRSISAENDIVLTDITLDESTSTLYLSGYIVAVGTAVVIAMTTNGTLLWGQNYTSNTNANSILYANGSLLLAVQIDVNTSAILTLNKTNGYILEQNLIPRQNISRLKQGNTGEFLFTGTAPSEEGVVYNIINQGTNNYLWTGGTYSATTDPVNVPLYRGETYTFNINALGHPFWIKTTQTTGTGDQYNTGVINNGTDNGTITFTVPYDAPSTLYYNCQFHTGMSGSFLVQDNPLVGSIGGGAVASNVPEIKWKATFGTSANDVAYMGGTGYAACGTSATGGFVLNCTVTESAGVYTVSKNWSRILTSAVFKGLLVTPTTEATKYIYLCGSTMNGQNNLMGMQEAILVKYDNSGALLWQNQFGHDMNEEFVTLEYDLYNRNIYALGKSTSHTAAQDAVIFRFEPNGFGTGKYHVDGSNTMPYYYLSLNLTSNVDSSSLTQKAAPSNSNSTVVLEDTFETLAVDSQIGGMTSNEFNGSYGPNGVFMLFFGYIELDKLQLFLNSPRYDPDSVNPAPEVFTLWQIATVGDGFADDGNIFGYDIIEGSNGKIYILGQTSGDVVKTNTGASGVYDYLLVELIPELDDIDMYQNGTELDEEMYALTELDDGRIAFTGRTTSSLGGTPAGGYDILLGIYNPLTDTSTHYSIGSGLDDRGVDIHNLGNNELAIVYTTYGAIGDQTNQGSEDIGVVKFNYSTNTWGQAYQTGTFGSDLINQNGKPSALLGDGTRIAVVFSTGGNFDLENPNVGYLDIAVGVLDLTTGDWVKAQVGSQASEVSTSVHAEGERLFITGYITDTFSGNSDSVFAECDVEFGIRGIASVQ